MRLIDAEAFVKEMCNNCDGWCEDTKCDCLNCKRNECRCDLINELMEAQTVDAVPVVRCKDCKHWSRICDESYLGEPGLGKCRNERFFAFEYGFETEDNFTCADGERKGGDE